MVGYFIRLYIINKSRCIIKLNAVYLITYRELDVKDGINLNKLYAVNQLSLQQVYRYLYHQFLFDQ